jgi:ATP/maltotriose-dependent transcriptional regulator MalT
MSCLIAWAEVAHFLGDVTAARRLYDLLAPWAGQFGTNRVYTNFTVDGQLGALATLLGELDRAEEHFVDAERMATARGARFVAAFDDLNRARLQRARGGDAGRQQAEHYATRSLERAREGGYGNVEQRATAFLADLAAV